MKIIFVAALLGVALPFVAALDPALAIFLVIAAVVIAGFLAMGKAQVRDYPLSIAGLVLAALLAPSLAFAQAAPSTAISLGDLWAGLVPYIVAAVGAVVTFLIGAVLNLLKTKTGLSIDDSMRSSLQTAATNAAGLVLNQLGNQLAGKTIKVSNPLVADAVNYVIKAAPDAIAHFGLTPEAIAEKIVALLPQVANTTITATTPAK